MHVEKCCQALLAEVLTALDENRSGWAIEIGVGTFNLYCELFDKLGYPTVAVEPLPLEMLRKLCRYRNIKLIESCVTKTDGSVEIYLGTWKGKENLNLSSIRSDWWGATTTKKTVSSIKLSTLLEQVKAKSVTCLKIDVEGAEAEILEQLKELSDPLIPDVLMFEYGGGNSKQNQKGGWLQDVFEGTLNSLKTLQKLGYHQTIIIDSSPETQEKVFDLSSIETNFDRLFDEKSIYGNIITLRTTSNYPESKLHNTCSLYRDNNQVPPSLNLKESWSKRAILKMRRLINI
jgi:FkbM family methyltransferase